MFRTEIFIEDKKLVSFLKAITGLVVSMTPPQPVVNAEKRNGKVVALTDGTIEEMFAAHLKSKSIEQFSVEDARSWMKDLGRAPASYGYVLKRLHKAKRIKMVKRGHWAVV